MAFIEDNEIGSIAVNELDPSTARMLPRKNRACAMGCAGVHLSLTTDY